MGNTCCPLSAWTVGFFDGGDGCVFWVVGLEKDWASKISSMSKVDKFLGTLYELRRYELCSIFAHPSKLFKFFQFVLDPSLICSSSKNSPAVSNWSKPFEFLFVGRLVYKSYVVGNTDWGDVCHLVCGIVDDVKTYKDDVCIFVGYWKRCDISSLFPFLLLQMWYRDLRSLHRRRDHLIYFSMSSFGWVCNTQG